jgi:hypothetical protein
VTEKENIVLKVIAGNPNITIAEQLHILNGLGLDVFSLGSEEGEKRKSFLLGRLEASDSLKKFLPTGEMPRHKIPRYLDWCGDGHLITIAPTRSGKGVDVVISPTC